MTRTIRGRFTERTEYAVRLPDGGIMVNPLMERMPFTLEQAEEVLRRATAMVPTLDGAKLVTRVVLEDEWVDVPTEETP